MREKSVEGRPHALHLLHQADGHFDSRFNAYLLCEGCLHDVYVQVLKLTHAALFHEIGGIVSNGYREYQRHAESKLPLTCITSGLAGSDKAVVTDALLHTLECLPSGGAVVDCHCHHVQSAHDLLSEIAEGLRDNLQNRDTTTRGGGAAHIQWYRHQTTCDHQQSLIGSSAADKDGCVVPLRECPRRPSQSSFFNTPICAASRAILSVAVAAAVAAAVAPRTRTRTRTRTRWLG